MFAAAFIIFSVCVGDYIALLKIYDFMDLGYWI